MRKMLKKKKERSLTLAHPQKEKPSGKISEVIIKMKKLLPLYENAILNCSRGKQDFDCNVYDYGFDDEDENEDFDLSSHARDKDAAHNEGSGEVIPKAGPRIKIPE